MFVQCMKWILVAWVYLLLMSCHTVHPRHETAIQQSLSTLEQAIRIDKCRGGRCRGDFMPPAVDTALLPPLSHYVAPSRSVARFDVNANNVPAREFFMGLVAGTKYNMVVHPNVTGNISVTLRNVTLEQALKAVRNAYGYDFHSTSFGYEVLQPKLESRIFQINYIDVSRVGKSYMQLTTGQISNKIGPTGGLTLSPIPVAQTTGTTDGGGLGTISSVETKSDEQFWKFIEATLNNIIGQGGGRTVTVNPISGVVAIRALPGELHRVARFIDSVQKSLNRQVIIEAKILEVQLDDSFQAGVDWSILKNPALVTPQHGLPVTTDAGAGQAANQEFPNTDLKRLDGIFAWRIRGSFKVLIELLQTQGNVQILSSPHLSTVNNQKAVLKVGQDEFFVTGVSTTNTLIGTNTLPSQNVILTPFFSGVTLDITPEISCDRTIVLHIHPSVSKVTEQQKTIGVGTNPNGTPNNLVLPLALSTIRESDSIVRAKSGQVIVIGGLMQTITRETLAATPWISKVPFLGSVFRRTQQFSTKSELVILLKPTIATNTAFIDKMEKEKRTFQILRRPFHAGGLPKVFGNEAERASNE